MNWKAKSRNSVSAHDDILGTIWSKAMRSVRSARVGTARIFFLLTYVQKKWFHSIICRKTLLLPCPLLIEKATSTEALKTKESELSYVFFFFFTSNLDENMYDEQAKKQRNSRGFLAELFVSPSSKHKPKSRTAGHVQAMVNSLSSFAFSFSSFTEPRTLLVLKFLVKWSLCIRLKAVIDKKNLKNPNFRL